METLATSLYRLDLAWIKAHANIERNEMKDLAAKEGAAAGQHIPIV